MLPPGPLLDPAKPCAGRLGKNLLPSLVEGPLHRLACAEGTLLLVRGRYSWREGQPYPMMGRTSGSLYRRGRAERASADATVTVPILPVNMSAMSTHSAEGGKL